MRGKVRCLAPSGDWCGEGILWHPDEQAVYWTDINRFLVHRLESATDAVRTWFFDEPVTTVIRTSIAGLLLLVTGSGTVLWEPATNVRRAGPFQLPGWPQVRCNDAAADDSGALWVGSMRNNVNPDGTSGTAGGRDGKLVRVSPRGEVKEWQHGLGIANTLVWNTETRVMYFGDSLQNAIWAFDYDRDQGALSGQRPFFYDFARGVPDGSAIDKEGFVWNCRFGGGCIVRLAPNGQVDHVLELPVSNVTNCTFGGPEMRTLFITTASLESRGERLAGSLFAVDTETIGVPDGVFQVIAA